MAYNSNTSRFSILKTYGKSRHSHVYGQDDDFDKCMGIEDVQLTTTFISPEPTDSNKVYRRAKHVKNTENKMKTDGPTWTGVNKK